MFCVFVLFAYAYRVDDEMVCFYDENFLAILYVFAGNIYFWISEVSM